LTPSSPSHYPGPPQQAPRRVGIFHPPEDPSPADFADGDGGAPWFGAAAARTRLAQTADRATFIPSVVFITGPPGSGKTRLLREAGRLAASRGFAVHSATADAWDAAVAHLRAGSPPGDPAHDGWPPAVLLDLAGAEASAGPRAVWAPHRLLACARSQARPCLLVATTDGLPPAVAAQAHPAGAVTHISLPPLTAADARALLAWQPHRLDDDEGDAVLALAAGNPGALLELARALAADDWPARAVRLPPSTRELLGQRLAALPSRTRRLLLGAAAAGRDGRLTAVLSATQAWLADFGPAERRHLVLVLHDRVAFADRLTRVAAYEGATAGERRDMHLALAARASGPDRAWHRARVALPGSSYWSWARWSSPQWPPSHWASSHEFSQPSAPGLPHGVSHGPSSLGPPPHRTGAAGTVGRPGRASAEGGPGIDPLLGLLGDPDIGGRQVREIVLAGALATVAGGRAADRRALGQLTQRARQVAARLPREPAAAWGLLRTCAEVTVVGPAVAHDCAGPELFPADGGLLSAADQVARAVHAWICGDWTASVRGLRRVMADHSCASAPHPVPGALLIDGLIQCGLWVEAERRLADARSAAAAPGGLAAVDALAGLLAALRHGTPPRPDPVGLGNGLATAIWCLAHGRHATLHGDNAAAFAAYRQLFDASGRPLHFALSPRGLPGLARTAHTPEQLDDADRALRAARACIGEASAAGVTVVLDWAQALLDPSPSATAALPLIAARLAALGRPYDQAVALADHGDRLRAARRVTESQDSLRAAASLFGRLGARADGDAVSGRLRATGVLGGPVPATGFDRLTAQQQQIARLASSGLTNKDIGARLKLSPRTIGSHLYQIYPVLGVVGRRQLIDVTPPQS